MNRPFRPQVEPLEQRWTPANNPSLPVPPLDSLPGASASIYLDFNGHTDATWGSSTNVDTPPFSLDGNINAYTPAEITAITEIWRHVSEDYAPFNINVTTKQPASFNRKVALRVAIGGDGAWTGAQIGGVAFLNTFGTGTGVTPTAFAFTSSFGTNVKALGDVISHEAGHMFGLEHQSEWNGTTKVQEYYAGLTDGTGPLMGVSYGQARSLWWFGAASPASTAMQNDTAVIANGVNGFGFRADDHGNNTGGATILKAKKGGLKPVNVSAKGLIGQQTDTDWFQVSARPGNASFTADVPNPYNNLDVKIELRNANGQVVASASPTSSFDATVTFKIRQAGTYYVVVSSAGNSSASTTNNRGVNIGTYTLNASYIPLSDPIKIYSPLRWTFDPQTEITSGWVTIASAPFSAKAPISLLIKLPDPTIEWISPNGVQVGDTVVVKINKDMKAGQPLRFFIQLYNPLNIPLGTFFRGLVVQLG